MECCFCEELDNLYDNQYYCELGGRIKAVSRIVIETDNWYAVPTLGCLTVGYILLICKQHHQSLANLDKELFFELLKIKNLVEKTLFERLGLDCLAFEHGTTDPCYHGTNTIDHVHLHIIPFTKTIWSDLTKTHGLFEFVAVADYEELLSKWQLELPKTYLLFQDLDKVIYYKPEAEGYPSQFFRKILAPYFSADQWNWKEEYYTNNFIRTLELFK